MPASRSLPRALARGLGAGLVGTAAMTAWQELAARLEDGGGDPPPGQDPWERASVPAQVAARAIELATGRQPPPERIPLLTHVTHWAYGIGWGAVYGLARRRRRPTAAVAGVPFGAGVWALSYLQLVPLGFYEPPWRYPPKTLALDLSYHLVYGLGVGAGHRALARV